MIDIFCCCPGVLMTNVRQRPLPQKLLVLQIFCFSMYKQQTISAFLKLQNEMLTQGCMWSRSTFLPALCCWSRSVSYAGANHSPGRLALFFFLRTLLPPGGLGQNREQMLCDLHQSLTDVRSEMDVGCAGGSGCPPEALPLSNTQKSLFLIKATHPLYASSDSRWQSLFFFLLHSFSKADKDTRCCPYWSSDFGNTL